MGKASQFSGHEVGKCFVHLSCQAETAIFELLF